MARWVDGVESGTIVKVNKITFRDFVPKWKKGYADQHMGEYTRRQSMIYIDTYLIAEKQYIFHAGRVTMYFPTTATNTWSKFLKRHNLPHIPLHGLRHTAGMLLRESGADLKTIQEQLRHSKIGTTADIYTHKSTMVSRAAIDPLEQLDPKQRKFAP